jgi:hypothetical protein
MEWDAEESKKATENSIDRIKDEVKPKTKEENFVSEETWFEDGKKVKLLDGKTYSIFPVNLKKARRLLQILKTVNVDNVIINYLTTEDVELDDKRQEELYEIMEMAFSRYNLDRDYLEENIDVVTATTIADIFLGLNGIKK